jgi:hypothetical protein
MHLPGKSPHPLFKRFVNFSSFFIFRKLICHITLLHFFSTLCVFCRIIVSVVFILLFHFFCSFLKRNFLFIAHSFFAIFTFYPLMSLKFLSFIHLPLFHTVPIYFFLSMNQAAKFYFYFIFHFLFFCLIHTKLYSTSLLLLIFLAFVMVKGGCPSYPTLQMKGR